jgi:hypothetical protein
MDTDADWLAAAARAAGEIKVGPAGSGKVDKQDLPSSWDRSAAIYSFKSSSSNYIRFNNCRRRDVSSRFYL